MSPPPRAPVSGAIIRVAMLTGILAFYGAATWLRGRPGATTLPAASLRTLDAVAMALCAFAVAAVLFLRVKGADAPAGRAATLTVVMLAVGEIPAIFAGVVYLMGGEGRLLGLGLLSFAAAMVASRQGRPA